MLSKAYIPFRGYYSTPFCRWQGSMADENSIMLGGTTAKRWLTNKEWNPQSFDYMILGITVGQLHQFYSSSWAAALMGATNRPAVAVSQACTTGTTCIYQAALGIETSLYKNCFVLTTDRTSNAPHTIWPRPTGMGGQVESEDWMIDNFNSDPNVGLRMIETAENVAKEGGFTKAQCDDLAYRRYEQYLESLAKDREFQLRFMFSAEVSLSKKEKKLLSEDEGVTPSSREALGRLKPVLPNGVMSFGAQTHPADGNCGIVVTTKDKAKELSQDNKISIQIISYGYARAKAGYMAMAPVPAAEMAIRNAGLKVQEIKAIKTHNPFIVNDLWFARQLNIEAASFNNYGCSMIYGHPQAPTAVRAIIEGIEEVVSLGGGYLLWAGCAAGDTGTAIILKIE